MRTRIRISHTQLFSQNSFRATRHAPGTVVLLSVSFHCIYRDTDSLYCMEARSNRSIISSVLAIAAMCSRRISKRLRCWSWSSSVDMSFPCFLRRMRSSFVCYTLINHDKFTQRLLGYSSKEHFHCMVGWPGETPTLELLGSSSRSLTVPMNQRPFKASRRVRTTLRDHATLGIEGVPTLHLSPSAAWDSLYVVLSMVCQGGDASRMTNVPASLSHLSAFQTMNTCTSCTLERWDARCAREGGVTAPHGRETSIPRPLKYIPLPYVLFVLVESEVSYAS